MALALVVLLISTAAHAAFAAQPADLFECEKTWGGAGDDIASDLVYDDSSGSVYIAGTSGGLPVLLKYDSSCGLQWARSWGSAGSGLAIALDSSGNPYLGGFSGLFGAADSGFVAKFDADGNLLWDRAFDVAPDAPDVGMVASGSDLYVVTRHSSAFLVAKFDLDGALVWSKIWIAEGDEFAKSVNVDGDGNVYVAGRSIIGGVPESSVIKLDPDGNLMWNRGWSLGSANVAEDSVINTDTGDIVLAIGGANAGFVLDISPAGSMVWQRSWSTGFGAAFQVVSFDGANSRILAAGIADGEAAFAEFDTEGNNARSILYGSGATGDFAGGADYDSDGQAYIAGHVGDDPRDASEIAAVVESTSYPLIDLASTMIDVDISVLDPQAQAADAEGLEDFAGARDFFLVKIAPADTGGPSNRAPVADAGADQTVDEGDVVTLDGSASADADGDTLTYTWSQTSGAPVSLSNVNSQSPSFTAPQVATDTDMQFSLAVSDGKLQDVDTALVRVRDSSSTGQGIPQEIKDAELLLYGASGDAIVKINGDMAVLVGKLSKDIGRTAFEQAVGKIAKMNLRDDVPTEAMAEFLVAVGAELESASFDELELTTRGLVTNQGIPYLTAIDDKHSEFSQAQVAVSPEADIALIVADIQAVQSYIEPMPSFIDDFKSRYQDIEDLKESGRLVKWGLLAGGVILGVGAAFTGGATLPFAAAALASAKAITVIEISSIGAQALALATVWGDVYGQEGRIVKIFEGEVESVVGSLQTGDVPSVSVSMGAPSYPGSLTLNSIGEFSAGFTNTGNKQSEARLLLYIIEPDATRLGPYYSESTDIAPGSTAVRSIAVPFPGTFGLALFGTTGTHHAVFAGQYGHLGMEKTTDSVTKSFEVINGALNFFRTIGLAQSGSTDVTVKITVNNPAATPVRVEITEVVPKELADSVDDIQFATPPTAVIEDDPVVMWRISLAAGETKVISYSVHSELEPEDILFMDFPATTAALPSGAEQSSITVIGAPEDLAQEAGGILQRMKEYVIGLPDSSFANKSYRKTLVLKADEVISKVGSHEYDDAISKLKNDIRKKVDGRKAPADWITDKGAAATVSLGIDQAVSLLGTTGP